MKLLCIADLRLGRQLSRVPEPVLEQVGAGSLGPAAAWARAADYP